MLYPILKQKGLCEKINTSSTKHIEKLGKKIQNSRREQKEKLISSRFYSKTHSHGFQLCILQWKLKSSHRNELNMLKYIYIYKELYKQKENSQVERYYYFGNVPA